MANVQPENGYTKIANELYDKILKTDLNCSQIKIVFAIMRNTYSFNRKNTNLSYSYLAQVTNVSKRQVITSVEILRDKKIIFVTENGKGKTNTLSINKDFDTWTLSGEADFTSDIDFTGDMDFTKVVNCTSPEVVNCTSPKKEIKKYINKYNVQNAHDAHFEHIWSLYPSKLGKGRISATKKKELAKISLEEWERIIDRYKKSVEADRENGFNKQYQNGSTFFNSGYVDYTDRNYNESETETNDMWKGYAKL